MARISNFVEDDQRRVNLHDPISATYIAHELDGRKLLQINTSGRSTRKLEGKVSQSIQLDEDSAGQLFNILKRHFGFS